MEKKKRIIAEQMIETIKMQQQLVAFERKLADYLTGANRGKYLLKRDLTPLVNKVKEMIEILRDEVLENGAWNDLEGFD